MKSKTDIIIQARIGSSRLPGKVMKDLAGYPMIYHVAERCAKSELARNTIIATSVLAQDDVIEDFCKQNNIRCFRGSESDVLSRYYEAAKYFGSENVVRVTSDCPLIDPITIDRCIEEFNNAKNIDYLSNVFIRTFPRGLDVEIFSFSSLKRAHDNATEKYEREHVTPYIWENKRGEFNIGKPVTASGKYKRDYRLTVDYQEDLDLVSEIYEALYNNRGVIDVRDAVQFLDQNPQIASINANCEQRDIH
jgi:spore coat polysaccharide biosynthesis protein SpsF